MCGGEGKRSHKKFHLPIFSWFKSFLGTLIVTALYYLGNYYAAHDEVKRAQDTWQILVQRFAVKKEGEISPWAELAQAKLQ